MFVTYTYRAGNLLSLLVAANLPDKFALLLTYVYDYIHTFFWLGHPPWKKHSLTFIVILALVRCWNLCATAGAQGLWFKYNGPSGEHHWDLSSSTMGLGKSRGHDPAQQQPSLASSVTQSQNNIILRRMVAHAERGHPPTVVFTALNLFIQSPKCVCVKSALWWRRHSDGRTPQMYIRLPWIAQLNKTKNGVKRVLARPHHFLCIRRFTARYCCPRRIVFWMAPIQREAKSGHRLSAQPDEMTMVDDDKHTSAGRLRG